MSKTNPIQSAKDTSDSSDKYGSNILKIYNILNEMRSGKNGGERIKTALKAFLGG